VADKQKSLEEAQKFLQKGNYARAIQCYEDALKADPEDERTLLRLGEAQQKANDNAGAFASYTRLAQQHTRNGFLLKATALYKRALALQPRDVDTHSRLADLYQQLGLVTDAMSFLYAATKLLQENQDQDGTLKVLERMASLEPNNVGIRIKIAEHWTKQEKPDKAVEEFRKAAKMLKDMGREEDYLKVVERILYFRPDELPLAQEIVRVYLARGDSRRSLAKLQHAARLDPRDTETLGLLAQTFEALQQPEKAYQVLREKARIHEFREEGEAAMDCWQRILVYQPDDPEARQRLGLDDPKAPSPMSTPEDTLPSPPPPSIRASRAARAIPAHTPQPDDLRLLAQQQQALEEKRLAEQRQEVERLLTETDVYIRYNLHDRATDHLRKVFLLDPNNLDAMERMKQIHYQSGYYPQAVDELLRMAKLAALTDRARALSYLREAIQLLPDHPETVEVGQQLGFTREEVFPQFFNGSLQHLAHALPDDESVDHLFSQLGAEIDGGALEGASPLMSYGEASPQEAYMEDGDDIEVEIEDDLDEPPAPPPPPPALSGLGLRRAAVVTPPPPVEARGPWSGAEEEEDSLAGVMLDPSDDNRAALVPSADLAGAGHAAPEEDFMEVTSGAQHDHASLVDLSELDDLDDPPPQEAPQGEDEDDLILMDDDPEEEAHEPPQEIELEDDLSASLGFDPPSEPPVAAQDHMFSPASIAELDSLDAGEEEDEDDGDLILMDEDIPSPRCPRSRPPPSKPSPSPRQSPRQSLRASPRPLR
jgi:tetratricopeptide (TPR) repeat protein